MPRIVSSYRRKDVPSITGRVFDRLVARYGKDSVLIDIAAIPPGMDFRDWIDQTLHDADVMLVMVGPKWLGPNRRGSARIQDPKDWPRIEVETALTKEIPIIPVLLGGAKRPTKDQLPRSLENFAFRHAAEVDEGQDFHQHVDRLVAAIDSIPPSSVKESTDVDRPRLICIRPMRTGIGVETPRGRTLCYDRIRPLLNAYPLAQNARLVIRHGKAEFDPQAVRIPKHE